MKADPIEPLEPRIAPASLTFTDVDGDHVVITTSPSPGALVLGVNVAVLNGQLLRVDLTDEDFQGVSVSIVATRDPVAGGDGHVNVGEIDATGIDLGAVLVDGDLGHIAAGSGTDPAHGLASLKVGSLGRMGTTTGAPTLTVFVDGRLGSLKVAGDVSATQIRASTLGSATIGGSLIGGPNDGNGLFETGGDMGKVKVGGDLVGGGGNATGTFRSGAAIASVTIGGSIYGGTHPGTGGTDLTSGAIVATGTLGPVKIGRDVHGNTGQFSGFIFSTTQIVSVTIGGSLVGSGGTQSGIISTPGLCGPVTITGDLIGGFGPTSGAIAVTQDITSVTVGGSLIGGSGSSGGVILSTQGVLGPVKIGGDIKGGTATLTGRVFGETRIVSVSVGGSLVGGHKLISSDVVDDTGRIHSDGAIGPVSIGRDILGGGADRSGYLDAATTLGAVTLGGSLIGGSAAASISDCGDIVSGGAMGFVKIGRDIIAGDAARSGQVDAGGTLAGITLGGSLFGDAARQGLGGATNIAGEILSTGAMGPVKIAGDIIGGLVSDTGRVVSMSSIASVTVGGSVRGDATQSGEILSTGALGPVKIGGDLVGRMSGSLSNESGYIEARRIASLFIGGSIFAGIDGDSGAPKKSGSVRAVDDIGPIVIKGSLIGSIDTDGDSSDGDFKPVFITARGQAGLGFTAKNDVAIKSIAVGGRVEFAEILAGYDTSLAAKNADAQIGAIVIGGDVIASSIVAGVGTPAAFFGTAADAKISGGGVKDSLDANGAVSKIASVVIKGSAFGTADPNDTTTFAIAAQQLGALTVGGTIIPLKPGPSNDLFAVQRRLGATLGTTTDGFDFHAFEV